jgi:hypothetical protein
MCEEAIGCLPEFLFVSVASLGAFSAGGEFFNPRHHGKSAVRTPQASLWNRLGARSQSGVQQTPDFAFVRRSTVQQELQRLRAPEV